MSKRSDSPFGRTMKAPHRRAIARDVFGRELFAGDQVMIQGLKDWTPVFTLHSASPDLRPQVPPNVLLVKLSAPLSTHVPSDQPSQLILIRTAEEAGTIEMTEAPNGGAADANQDATLIDTEKE